MNRISSLAMVAGLVVAWSGTAYSKGSPTWQAEVPLKLMIGGKDIETATRSGSDLKNMLSLFADKSSSPNLNSWIDSIHPPSPSATNPTSVLLKGPGGMAARQALEIAKTVVGPGGDHIGVRAGSLVYGKIID